MTVHDYIAASNAHYYASRDPLGKGGDFTTAPEISQMFGEMVGACLADCFLRAGAPADAAYCELGPGRGTLASDALKLLRGVGFSGPTHFVETSPALRAEQERRHPTAVWHDSVDDLPECPLLIVANEFFDALPTRQFIGEEERRVVMMDGKLAFEPEGEVAREASEVATDIAFRLAAHLAQHGGAALVIDYGYAGGEQRDTLQAVKRHEKVDPLSAPGEADLTTHVDFVALARAAQEAGARTSRVISQGNWLETLGLGPRAMTLAGNNPERADDIAAQRRRLSSDDGMGTLFKVMAIHHRGWPVPAGLGQ
ncbi:SAM-dependent methyltransferase [Sphingomicrobium aestuariivivum]|nr:SAM-dependent methyltransferase [Sphingomicrobium aestuariivivum]MCJ8190880.1 SAM-dependent methyltransferase [Sphingomicrobium aestuariivivum]